MANWKAFASGFMTDQARQINERVARAQAYEDKQREEFERSKSTFKKRLGVVNNTLMPTVSNLKRLGATDMQIKAAVANGPETILEFYEALDSAAKSMNKDRLTVSEIDAVVDMPDTFEGGDMSLHEFISQTYGLTKPDIGSTKDPSRSFLSKALGLDLQDQVRANLDREARYNGFSIMDLNELAAQDSYNSLVPNTYFRLTPGKTYSAPDVLDDFNRAIAVTRQQVQNDDAYKDLKIKDADAAANIMENSLYPIIEAYTRDYGINFLNDKNLYGLETLLPNRFKELRTVLPDVETANAIITESLGDGGATASAPYVGADGKTKLATFTMDIDGNVVSGKIGNQSLLPEDADKVYRDLVAGGYIKDVSFSKGVEGSLVTEGDVFPDTRTVDSAFIQADEGGLLKPRTDAPPRPEKDPPFFRRFNVGGKEAEDILKGAYTTAQLAKSLTQKAWDDLFGDTHNPDGSLKDPDAASRIGDINITKVPERDEDVSPTTPAGTDPLSIRNNNPGNLKMVGQKGAEEGEQGFAKFKSKEAGLRALRKQVVLDTQTRGKTLREFITKYAPPSENDTEEYINFVSNKAGIPPDGKIPMGKINSIMEAKVEMEGGAAAVDYYLQN